MLCWLVSVCLLPMLVAVLLVLIWFACYCGGCVWYFAFIGCVNCLCFTLCFVCV